MEGLLILGAFAIVLVLFSFFTLEFHTLLTNPSRPDTSEPLTPPRLDTKISGNQAMIVEVNEEGETIRTLYSSSLTDDITDFSLFAIPQENYQGIVYVRAILDTDLTLLKIYPFDVATGQMQAATLSVDALQISLSANQEIVGILDKNRVALYRLIDGTLIKETSLTDDQIPENMLISFDEHSCLLDTNQPQLEANPLLCLE